MYRDFGPFNEVMVKKIARQILKALKFTHEKNIIHGDLKAANVLFDGNQIKLSDFGESLNIELMMGDFEAGHSRVMCPEINGSMLWMAPEIFLEKPRGRKSDIWSFGCLLIELFTAMPPWPDIKEVGQILDMVSERRIP
jgi:serine/threonine protein kinase